MIFGSSTERFIYKEREMKKGGRETISKQGHKLQRRVTYRFMLTLRGWRATLIGGEFISVSIFPRRSARFRIKRESQFATWVIVIRESSNTRNAIASVSAIEK